MPARPDNARRSDYPQGRAPEHPERRDAPEAWVLAAAKQGDVAARAELLRRLQDTWYRYCYSQLGDAENSRDATQETALRFLQKLDTFRGDSALQTWSLGIALNVCRERRRRERSVPVTLTEHDIVADDAAPHEDRVSHSEDRTRLSELMKALPPRQREAIVLRFFQDMRLEQVADTMGCAVGTVKATINQALRSLRKRWEEHS